jgi:sugar/nucleoside kinase (ribokinase family)
MSTPLSGDIVVAGHICLDLIPGITARRESIAQLLLPGKLLNVGPVVTATGGAVANTGLALHKLGVPVRLVGKVGTDAFGGVIQSIVRSQGPGLDRFMVEDPASDTSYTVVISPPGIDRVFLHHPGANDTFAASDVTDVHLRGASLFHLGYPPIMRRLYDDGGDQLARLFRKAKDAGLVTSLDMSMPDPDSDAGRVDWKALLSRVLPHVDFFMPSFDELAFMLGIDASLAHGPLQEMADWVIEQGAAGAIFKLGDQGAYLRTSTDPKRLLPLGSTWAGRELLTTCYEVDLVGATGSGDCTIAGMLAAIHAGSTPEHALAFAAAVGACNVEAPDATSGIRSREKTLERMASGWKKRPSALPVAGWRLQRQTGIWSGPQDLPTT